MNATDCMSRNVLKQYLAGWVDTAQTVEIEQHLSECQACEQTIAELEGDPDTLLESVQKDQVRREASSSVDSLVNEAVARAKRLMDAGPATVSEIPPTSANLGVYELIRPIGRGGMGAVFLARHRTLGKQMAIKILPRSWATRGEAAARFQREIRAAGKLNHRSIVAATDAGEEQGTHYLVMEFIDGMDLSHLARLAGPLSVAEACALIRQAALGLSYAHAEGIVHRDVKPSNLMLDGLGQTKILDFGLAQLCLWDEVSAELTSVGQLMGTLDYMAPEQAERSGSVDFRADLYSLGATLFRLLCGRAPLAAAPNLSPLDKLRLLAQHEPPRLDTLRPDAPPELVELVASLLAREPKDRPGSAAHVAELLARFANDADLPGLLARARTAESQLQQADSPQPIFTDHRVVPAPPKQPLEIRDGTRGWSRWMLTASLIVLGIVAGVLIVLDSQKGQIVIESEVAGVQVSIVRDGEPVRQLRLETGATSTRLSADRYQVVIDTPSDAVEVDKDTLVVKRGQTVVARIRTKGTAATRDAVNRDDTSPVSKHSDPVNAISVGAEGAVSQVVQEPLYDGKTLGAWLRQLSRDRSPKALGDALVALEAMITPATKQRIRDELIKILPQLDGDIQVIVEGQAFYTVDSKGFGVLAKTTTPQEYSRLLATLLDDADADWGLRILNNGLPRHRAESISDLEPVFTWIGDNLLRAKIPSDIQREWVPRAGWWCRSLLVTDSGSKLDQNALADRVIPMLERSRLGNEFWLAQVPGTNSSPRLRDLTSARAVNALSNSETSAKHVAQAAMILTWVFNMNANLDNMLVSDVRTAVRSRMAELVKDRNKMLDNVEVDKQFQGMAVPKIASIQITPQLAASAANEMLELIELAIAVKQKDRDEAWDVTEILNITKPSYEKANEAFGSGKAMMIAIQWPDLGTASGNFRGPAPAGALKEFTTQDWIAYILYVKAAELGGLDVPELIQPLPRKKP